MFRTLWSGMESVKSEAEAAAHLLGVVIVPAVAHAPTNLIDDAHIQRRAFGVRGRGERRLKIEHGHVEGGSSSASAGVEQRQQFGKRAAVVVRRQREPCDDVRQMQLGQQVAVRLLEFIAA